MLYLLGSLPIHVTCLGVTAAEGPVEHHVDRQSKTPLQKHETLHEHTRVVYLTTLILVHNVLHRSEDDSLIINWEGLGNTR